MDLAKFISLLSKGSLYFACPSEFDDPFEGYVCPKNILEDNVIKRANLIKVMEPNISDLSTAIRHLKSFDEEIKNLPTDVQRSFGKVFEVHDEVNAPINKALNIVNELDKFLTSLKGVFEKNIRESGVSCWHKSEYESEAMWKLYSVSGQGIAIESTIGKLKESIKNQESLKIASVTYIPENDPNKEYLKHDPIFLKRKSFEHEKELRAKVSLKEVGEGVFVECDLDILINRIHVSPLVEPYFKEVVESICAGKVRNINKPVTRSILFEEPNYALRALAAQ
ncbi:DUF2971 domain-containing protein [Methyloglobulus morosus]|nr:DUF2971 domain-containing protein [Methyloglobulus morosus]